MFVFMFYFYVNEKDEKTEEPAQRRKIGDNVVRRTSCQQFQQHLYRQVLPAVFIGHTENLPCCTHLQPRQSGTTEPQTSQRAVDDDMARAGWARGRGLGWGQNGYGMSPRPPYPAISYAGPLGRGAPFPLSRPLPSSPCFFCAKRQAARNRHPSYCLPTLPPPRHPVLHYPAPHYPRHYCCPTLPCLLED